MHRPESPPPARLPADRAFVVQFADGAPGGGELLRGRAEHIDSGRSVHFDSLGDLNAFIEDVLRGLPAGARKVGE